MHTQLGIASVWLGEAEEAEKYLKKALDQCSARQVMHYQYLSLGIFQHDIYYGNQMPLSLVMHNNDSVVNYTNGGDLD